MRIIAGDFRGHVLRTSPGLCTRPTTSRVREAMFGLVEARMSLHGAHVLDLFAGSGALALEALSRGAAYATLVEANADVLHAARDNGTALGVDGRCRFLRADVLTYLKRYREDPVDLIMADPPYDLASVITLPELALKRVRSGGLLVLEHSRHFSFDTCSSLDTTRVYGRTRISVFKA